jgi:putative transposon-encoded protein
MGKKNVKGVLILEQIEFENIYKRTVHRSNKTSGKITLPQDLIGEEVYAVMPKKEKKKKR